MNSWSGQRVLVTGGAGFIGSHLTQSLVALGARVRVVDNLVRGRLENLSSVAARVEFMADDLTAAAACERSCAGIEIVFHLASKVGSIGYYLDRPGEVYENNVLMDTQVLLAARRAGVKRYLFSSSAHVYPRHLQTSAESPALREEQAYPADPAISYGWAKLVTERLIQYQNEEGCDMRTAIVRIVGAFGENQDIGLETASAIPAFCRRAIEFPGRSPFTILGEGRETRSYCYVGDIVQGMLRCVERLSERKEIGPLNLGNEGRISIAELARTVIGVSGKTLAITHAPAKESGIKGQAVDIGKAKELLGWTPLVTLREGILRTYRNVEERMRAGER